SWASMGPPAYTDGDPVDLLVVVLLALQASMGPPAYTDGDRTAAPTFRLPPHCFNGAAGLHRRRPSSSARRPSFNGAAGLHRRRRHRASGRPSIADPRFNGAAGLHRRRPSSTAP